MRVSTVAVVFAAALAPAAHAQENLVLATASTGGTYYPVGVGIARVVSEAAPDLRVDAVTSGGSTENVRLIARDEVDMAISNGVVTSLARSGEEGFDASEHGDLRTMFALWGNVEHHLALKDAVQTGTVDDLNSLDGKYNIGGRQSGARTAATLMLRGLGIDPEGLDLEYIATYGEAGSALQDGRIAAANLGAGVPVAAVTEAYATLGDDVTILSFTDAQLARIEENSPGLWYPTEIPAGSYPGQDDPIPTAAYANFMIVDADVPEETVYKFMTAVFDNIDQVHDIHPAAQEITLEAATSGLSAPLHPGAVRFYEERGIEVPDRLRP
ncbi:TAXI family TRAP transporter solute-binding subunit [Acuticoccus sp.]|uniref:TAXI family TRAP transporter solute-binding subunit n=1 Tax=Acuticoccus sp. TaxID=1904378 RepID=UPI003B52C223